MILLYKTYEVEYEYLFDNHAKTILLLHGWGGNKDSFARIKKVFKCSYNILSISFPPLNLYTKQTNSTIPLDMCNYKNIVLNLLQLLNLNSVIIICHSFGFRVSLMLTTTNINIEKIIVTGGAGIRLKPNFLKKLQRQFNSIWLKTHPQDFNKIASSEYITLSNVDRQTFKNVVNKNLTAYIKNLTCPAFLFWGTKDTATPLKFFKIIKKIKHDIKYKIIKNGTHFCYLDHSELFIDYCDKFLNNEI
ncbi:MAG: alpha/beta hydrolase [Clostridia bacterium]|nr:alpha/beta hydrolase [Clostridia bacterium]